VLLVLARFRKDLTGRSEIDTRLEMSFLKLRGTNGVAFEVAAKLWGAWRTSS
jgi:hypothetical protein